MATSADRAHGRDEMARQIVKRLEEKKVMFPKSFTTEEKRVNAALRALDKHHGDFELAEDDLTMRYGHSPKVTVPASIHEKKRKEEEEPHHHTAQKHRRKEVYKTEVVKNEKNHPLVEAINEISARYFEAGDEGRGAKYAFVSKVLRETDHAVETKDDLTKIEGIGGHIDEDIHEF